VALRPVTAETFRAVCRLAVRPDQQGFVATNAYSLAQMHFEPWLEAREFRAGEALVGFALFGRDPADGRWWIARFMVGADHQGRGLGRAALDALLRLLREERGAEEVRLSFVPANAVARRLYERAGFRDTGEVDPDGEIIFAWRASGMGGR
jgi:diamine N-acetyltransferase